MFGSFVTPWTVARQAPLSWDFSRQEYWSGLPFPSLGDIPDPGIEPTSPASTGRFFITEPPGKPSWSLSPTKLPRRMVRIQRDETCSDKYHHLSRQETNNNNETSPLPAKGITHKRYTVIMEKYRDNSF